MFGVWVEHTPTNKGIISLLFGFSTNPFISFAKILKLFDICKQLPIKNPKKGGRQHFVRRHRHRRYFRGNGFVQAQWLVFERSV